MPASVKFQPDSLSLVFRQENEAVNYTNASTPIQWTYMKLNSFVYPQRFWAFNGSNTTQAGFAPTGFNNYKALYENYYIYKTRIKLHIVNNGTTELTLLFNTRAEESPLTMNGADWVFGATDGLYDLRETPGVRKIVIPPYNCGKNSRDLVFIANTKKIIGNKHVYDENWWGNLAVLTDPPRLTIGVFNIYPTGNYNTPSGTQTTIMSYSYRWQMDYYCRLFNKILPKAATIPLPEGGAMTDFDS